MAFSTDGIYRCDPFGIVVIPTTRDFMEEGADDGGFFASVKEYWREEADRMSRATDAHSDFFFAPPSPTLSIDSDTE